jgi:hypothetical protein
MGDSVNTLKAMQRAGITSLTLRTGNHSPAIAFRLPKGDHAALSLSGNDLWNRNQKLSLFRL